MVLQLIGLVLVLVLAVTGALWARQQQTQPALIVNRIRGVPAAAPDTLLLPQPHMGRSMKFAAALAALLPPWLLTDKRGEHLIQAGFRSHQAPAIYAETQLGLAALGGVIMATLLANRSPLIVVSGVLLGLLIGFAGPATYVERRREHRQEQMRHGLPDMLDLLLVCVEAGTSLDAAILRVGRELSLVHPELSDELMTLSRKQNAGISRQDALHGMWHRTGLVELRALSSNILQSERWGTSIARVLRVNADVMRRKRREAAEKRAALASTKMIFPLALLILPALLIVIGGPMLIQIGDIFDAIARTP